jgi:hypothetical protein
MDPKHLNALFVAFSRIRSLSALAGRAYPRPGHAELKRSLPHPYNCARLIEVRLSVLEAGPLQHASASRNPNGSRQYPLLHAWPIIDCCLEPPQAPLRYNSNHRLHARYVHHILCVRPLPCAQCDLAALILNAPSSNHERRLADVVHETSRYIRSGRALCQHARGQSSVSPALSHRKPRAE